MDKPVASQKASEPVAVSEPTASKPKIGPIGASKVVAQIQNVSEPAASHQVSRLGALVEKAASKGALKALESYTKAKNGGAEVGGGKGIDLGETNLEAMIDKSSARGAFQAMKSKDWKTILEGYLHEGFGEFVVKKLDSNDVNEEGHEDNGPNNDLIQ